MRTPLRFIILIVVTGSCFAQPKPGAIAAAGVWQPPQDFRNKVTAACGAPSQERKFADCFTTQMSKAGAPAAAVNFTRELYKQSSSDLGVMTAFHHVGPVDIAWVVYPLHEPSDYGLFLINGDPEFVNIEDLKQLDQKAMQQSFQFQDLQGLYPKVGLWHGDRKGLLWPNSQRGASGGLQFIVGYPLRNGCSTCTNAGAALFTWNFAADGKFVGTSFMGLTPAPFRPGSSSSPE